MRPCVKIFQNDLLNCMGDCRDILQECFSDDKDAMILVKELVDAENMVRSLPEPMMIDFIEAFNKLVGPMKPQVAKRNKNFFQGIEACEHCMDETSKKKCVCPTRCEEECDCEESCINCSKIVTKMDSKTFKAIKKILGAGEEDDVKLMFKYIDSFIELGEQYHKSTKEKTS